MYLLISGEFVFFYWLSALVLGAYISFRYVPTFSTWVQTVTYLYAGKNSVVQILCSSAILLIVLGKDYNSRFSIVKWAYILFAFVMTFLLRGRTAILSTVIAISVFVLSSKGNTKKRVTFVVIVCVILIAIISDDSLNLIVRHALGLDTYQSIDLDRFSSGRLTLYKNAIDLFASNWLIGVGDYYVDNFYINSITTLGIIGGGPLILMWVVRIIMIIRNFKKNPKNLICVASMTLSVFYFIESLLEAYPPFGPGSCSFMFWLLCGLSDSGFCLLEGESVKKQLTS